MLIHIRHALQKELVPDRLMFRFEAAPFHGRLEAFGRWIRREKAENDLPQVVEIHNGDRLFFQLPPAAGPSCFWLPASGSECRIMISPLNSLDRQGQASLRMTPKFSDDGTHIIYTELWVGKSRLLYISPESLISRTFREDLNRIVKGVPPGSLIIDEAQAISEWSGNFRSAYQRIPRMIEDLRRYNPGLSVVVVTAASGKWLGRDVRAMLDLADRSPALRRNFYRERVSLQAAVARSPEEKETVYEQLLWRDIPALLAREEIAGPAMTTFPQYRDPYDLCFGNRTADPGNPADITVAERRFMDSGSPHILIHTGMGDSVADWLYKTGEAGRGGHRLHGIRLADLPSDECEADLEQRLTRIPRCRGRVCPFGRASLCDYGKQHHLIQQSHPEIRQVFTDTCRTLGRLLASVEAGDPPARIPLPVGDGGRTALALHRLSLLGVIEIFFVDYRESPPVFKVYGFKPKIKRSEGALRVFRYLSRNDISHPMAPPDPCGSLFPENPPEMFIFESGDDDEGAGYGLKTDAWLQEAHAAQPLPAYERHRGIFHRLAVYLLPVLQYISGNQKDMAYRRLWNLKTFMKTDGCRYALMLRTVHAVDEGWRCRACDRCRPELAFDLMAPLQARLPGVPEATEKFLREWLEADDVPSEQDGAAALLSATAFADRAEDLTVHAQHLLEEDPRNLKALRLLVELSAGGDRRRYEQDLMNIVEGDRRLARVMRLCETDPEGVAILQALSDLVEDAPMVDSAGGPGIPEADGETSDRQGDAPVLPLQTPGPDQSGSGA